MASGLSDSADITSSEIEDGFVNKRKAEAAVIKGILAERLPMDQTDTTTSSRTNDSSQPSEPKDVFLSHSGKQKNFVRQLYRDLTNQGVSCFFDQDPESLPVAEDFPPRIFEAIRTCKVAVLLLSKDFLESKWPMLELSAFVEAKKTTNPILKILPLFFRISPDALKNTTENKEKWKQSGISGEKQDEWQQALKAIRPINGLLFNEGGDEVEFREKIVKAIWKLLPKPSPRYDVSCMQGEERICEEVVNLFETVLPNRKGILIAGLYGTAGQGKTTLGKAFCNYKLGDFEGKVCHLEFSKGDAFERKKLALQHLTNCPQQHLQTLTSQDQVQIELCRRVKGQRIFLVLDNITDESIDEVRDYLRLDLQEKSHILLSARSLDVLRKRFNIEKQSCMRVPRLEEDEAIAILLEGAFPGESTLGAEERRFALKCAKRCLFKETSCEIVPTARTFHPLALKAFGSYLISKYGSNLSKWASEIDGMVDRVGEGLDEVFSVLGKAFDDMPTKHRTIFMLLTVYMLPNISSRIVRNWLAINCNEEIGFIERAVEDLRKKAFIEEFEPKVRIHDLYTEFAQIKANEMGRCLWWKREDEECSRRGLISEDDAGFELAKLEQCMYRRIAPKYLRNLFVLQLVDVKTEEKVELGMMDRLRSITLLDCKDLKALDGMEKLVDLAWLQIRGVHVEFKLPELSSLEGLQHLEINIACSKMVHQLGDLTYCFGLREIYVVCPSLLEFPRLKGLQHLETVEFSVCDKVTKPLDCTDCVKLETIVLSFCCQMTASPLLKGCKKLSKLILSECDAVTACPDVDEPSALKTLELFISSEASSAPQKLEFCCELENLELWNMGELMELPSFKRLSNLTVLKLGKCGIREPPDLTGCERLEDIHFFTLRNLKRFPNFSSLRELKKLSLCNCISVQDPPDIDGCHQLQVFHLQYNDNLKGLSKMDKCPQLEEVKVSWHSKGEVTYEGIDPDNCHVDEDLESCIEYWKDTGLYNLFDVYVPVELEELINSRSMRVAADQYFRGVKLYYSFTAYRFKADRDYPFKGKRYNRSSITLILIDGKVIALPTLNQNRGTLNQNRDWVMNKLREYLDGREDIARASAASVSRAEESIPLPLSTRYRVPSMQGEARMCQELADFFNNVRPNENGIRIAGLYGMPGQGKTTLAKAFCNINLRDFDGKVCHLEFCRGTELDRKKLVLHCLTQLFTELPWWHPELEINEDDVHYLFKRLVKGKRVLLVLDDITDQNKDEVKYYLGTELGENSCILLSARNVDLLVKHFNIESQSCMHVPRLEDEEAIAILWERKPSVVSEFPAESRDFSLKCAKKCSFKNDTGFAAFHPLALKVFGRHLLRKQSKHLSNWAAEIDGLADGAGDGSNDVFAVLDKAFYGIESKCRIVFMLLIRCIRRNMSTENAFEWLAKSCNEGIEHIKKAVDDLCESAFVEEIEPEIRVHDLLVQFSQMNTKNKDDAPVVLTTMEDVSIPLPLSARYRVPSMQGEARMCQELADFFNSVHPNEKGIRIAGLYGMPGQGKTTLAKAFCNRNLRDFDCKVCYLELCGGDTLQRRKFALQYLTQLPTPSLASVTDEDDADNLFSKLVKGQRVLLVLDNITDQNIDEVTYYLGTDFGKDSCILLSTRRLHVLENDFKISSKLCMRVPRLEEEEAVAILCERAFPGESKLGAEDRGFAVKCAKKCSFKEDTSFTSFHPLALKAVGRLLFRKHSKHLSNWAAEIDGLAAEAGYGPNDVFDFLDKAFNDIEEKCRIIFINLARHKPPNMSTREVLKWLAITCNEGFRHIKKAVADLCESAFIEEIEPEIRIHELLKEFAQMTNTSKYDRLAKPRDKIVISPIHPLSPQRYHIPAMQGVARMCQDYMECRARGKLHLARLFAILICRISMAKYAIWNFVEVMNCRGKNLLCSILLIAVSRISNR